MLTNEEIASLKIGDVVYCVDKDHASFKMFVDSYYFSHRSKTYLNLLFGSFKITKANSNKRLFIKESDANKFICNKYKDKIREIQQELNKLEQENE